MKIGIIGAGAIARREHLPDWLSLGRGIEVVMIADVNSDLAKKVAEEFNVKHWTTKYEDILSNPSIDIVDVCVPTPMHFEIVMRALAAEKHVLVEKPLTMSLDHAFQIYKKVIEQKKVLSVVQNYRYMEPATRAKSRIDSNALGNIVFINGNALGRFPSGWTANTWLYHDNAVLYDFAPHLIDMILWLHPVPVKRVYAAGSKYGEGTPFLTSGNILLEFSNNSTAMLDLSWTTGAFLFDLELHGTGGSLFFEPMRDRYREIFGSLTPLDETINYFKEMARTFAGAISGKYFKRYAKAYSDFFREFVESIENNTEPPVTLEQIIQTMIVLEASKRSITTNTPISVSDLLREFNLPFDLSSRISGQANKE